MARLILETPEGQQTIELRAINTLGRHPKNTIQVLDKIVSKEHCVIELRDGRFVLRDLGTMNGTFVNGERVAGEAVLSNGDSITLGATKGTFMDGALAVAAKEAPGAPGARILAHLATDKPLYKPGEIVYARAALLDAFSRAPMQGDAVVAFEIRGPKGDVITSAPGQNKDGVAAFSWSIPEGAAGGEHRIVVTFPRHGFPPAELPFSIRAYRAPRLKLDLEFLRKAHGPGDEVVAALHAERAEGGIPAGAKVTVVATVDGVDVHRGETAIDASGDCEARFRLPAHIAEGEGTLVLIVRDGGVEETVARTIPIIVSHIKLSLFPEGGELVAGLPTRLYVEARTPKGKPADVAGRVLDGKGVELARFRTEHEGRGRVALTPARAGRAYMAVLDEPAGVEDLFPLPEALREGYTLGSVDDAIGAEEAVHLRVGATSAGPVRVSISSRDQEVAALRVTLAAGETREVSLTPPGTADGVLRATLHDASGLARAERIVFRKPLRALRVEVEALPAKSAPRGRVKVRVRTKDEAGKPVKGTVTLAVADDAVLETIERRERAPRLAVQALLGSEVRELADPAVYLEAGEAAAKKLDLLLGTQGWRRFAFVDQEAFLLLYGDAAARVLAYVKPPPPPPPPMMMMRPMGPPGGRMDLEGLEAFGPPPAPGGAPRFAPPPFAAMAMAPDLERMPAPAARAPMLDVPGPRAPAPQPIVAAPARPAAAPPAFAAAIAAPAPMPPGFFAPPPMQPPPPQIVAVREYAHRAATGGGRTDFAETLYWNADLSTSEAGEATVEIDLCDSVTSFRVRADAFARDGALGGGDATIEARRAFYVEPKLPLEVSSGDLVEAPIALVNGTSATLEVLLSAQAEGAVTALSGELRATLGPERRGRVIVPLVVAPGRGRAPVELAATAGDHEDRVTRAIEVAPAGFPVELCAAGRLDAGGSVTHALRLPEVVLEGSIVTDLVFHPTPLASLTQALEALLREPCGCFEQTSSSTYPNIMVLQYLSSHHGADVRLQKRASELVERGYRRLVGFECKEKGYEWFGGDPGHEALTAYGVMEFGDMAAVADVDQEMVARTRRWLLSQRAPEGGFKRNPRALDSFGGAPDDVTNAYITWALGQAKVPGIEAEVAAVRAAAKESDDAYYLALAAGVLLDAGDAAAAGALDRLASMQEEDGALRRAKTSITRSGGDNLAVETTSLAILGWLRSAAHAGAAEKAMGWLVERCKGGRFGATQATVLALKAIVAFDAAAAAPKAPGKVRVTVNGAAAGEASFGATATGAIALPSFAEALSGGEAKISIAMEDGAAMPYSLRIRCNTMEPASSPACKVDLRASLSRAEIPEGEAADVRVEIENRTDEGLPMVVAIIGLPGGLEARPDQLKELVNERRLDAWELRGREVILYLRSMAPRARVALPLSIVGAVPGRYEGPASRAYLYYTDEDKVWAAPLRARVVASGGSG